MTQDAEDTSNAEAAPTNLFRREAVRHNTPGLFGEVRLSAPPGSWGLTILSLCAVSILLLLGLGLEIEGQSLLAWVMDR